MNSDIRFEKVVSSNLGGKERVYYLIVQGARTVQLTLEELEHLAAMISSRLEEEKGGDA